MFEKLFTPQKEPKTWTIMFKCLQGIL